MISENIITDTLKADKAATTVQTAWRSYSARKMFGFKPLSKEMMTFNPTFMVGNDPKIDALTPHAAYQGNIAFIGTSGLRSIALLCGLSLGDSVPKLIIVDISCKVVEFWRSLREMVKSKNYINTNNFLEDFTNFLNTNQELVSALPNDCYIKYNYDSIKYENQNPILFVNSMVNEHGLEKVLLIIKTATIIAQSWTDKTLFSAIKNILEYNKIETTYVYPSNIPHCINDEKEKLNDLISNIERLAPKLSIFTNRCDFHMLPEKVILSTEYSSAEQHERLQPFNETCLKEDIGSMASTSSSSSHRMYSNQDADAAAMIRHLLFNRSVPPIKIEPYFFRL